MEPNWLLFINQYVDSKKMIPGEIVVKDGDIRINVGRKTITLEVSNNGDRPVQVGSHYHFYETNTELVFDRDSARGFRLDIVAGSAIRFEPGQTRTVQLVEISGHRKVHGFQGRINGLLDA